MDGITQQVKVFPAKPEDLKPEHPSQGLAVEKEKADSSKLSSNFHWHAMIHGIHVHTCTLVHTQRE